MLVGGAIMGVDTLWGGVAALILDLGRPNELALAITMVLGLPMYALDVWIDRRIAICLLALWLLRWAAASFAGPIPLLASIWRGNVLLILAFVLLQWSKWRRLAR
jgi:hypothetical protein